MTRTETNPDSSVLRLTTATVVAFLLTGVAILVQANTQIPPVSDSQRLLQLSGAATNSYLNKLPINATNRPARGVKFSRLRSNNSLSDDQLTQNALLALKTGPDYVPATQNENVIDASVSVSEHVQPLTINVNTFLLSHRVSDQSQLAELQMQPYFIEFDSALFREKKDRVTDADLVMHSQLENEHRVSAYSGIGFPHIETNTRSDSNRYKPYKQLVSFSSDVNGDTVPHVMCMGLSPQRVAERAKKFDAKIYELGVKHNVSVSLIKAVVAKESCYNPSAISSVGAIGLMQLMPETARWLKVQQPENPQQNLAGGVRYLAQLRKRFGSIELALAAYNAGPGNVERYNGIPPFAETQNYVQDVLYFYRGYVATTRFLNAQNSIEL